MSELGSAVEVRMAALNLLAMREHSAVELMNKLGRKFSGSDLIGTIIEALKEDGLQSDERFADAFVTMRQRQGKGSVVIKMELKERGISNEIIGALVNDADPVWVELVSRARSKRFPSLPQDARDKAKQARFLFSRGFSGNHIKMAFDYDDGFD